MIRPPVKGGTTPYGTCLSCLVPMRKGSEKPDAYPFKTTQRSNSRQCNYCRSKGRALTVYVPPNDSGTNMNISVLREWYAGFCLDRARRGVPPEGILFDGETATVNYKKAGHK